MSPPFTVFPAINAALNGTSAVLLLTGRRLIAQRKIQQHRAVMISAVITSSLFLACYLTYHALLQIYAHGAITRFRGTGLSRPIYFSILLSHTILAVVTVPLVLITLNRGLNARFDKHRAIARWTFPIWLYVSVTGVVIYFMLYQWFAA
jgi:uncharacterized membrane protein YozB (DUF420 family)